MQYSNIRQSFRNEAVAHIEYCCWQNYDLWIEWACLEHRRTVTKKALANGGMSWTNLVDDRSGLILWCCWSARSIVSPVTYSSVGPLSGYPFNRPSSMELCTATRVLVLFTFLQFSSVWIGYNCLFTEVSLFSTTTVCLHLTPANLVLGAERNYCIKYTKRCWLTDKIFMNKVWYWPLPIVISAVISILKTISFNSK